MKKDKLKLIFAQVLTDGTKIYHYLKPSGHVTVRMEIPKENARAWIGAQLDDIQAQLEQESHGSWH